MRDKWIGNWLRKCSMIAVVAILSAQTILANYTPSKVCMDAIKAETKASEKSAIKVAKNTKLKLNGKVVTIDAPIITDNGTTLLPIREISRLLNIQIEYCAAQKVVVLQSGETLMEVPVGYSFGIVNGEKKEIQDHKKAICYEQNTYLPVRFVSECLGVSIKYDKMSKTIEIVTTDLVKQPTEQVEEQTKQYNFRKAVFLTEHFNKHGMEFDYKDEQEYLAGANRVIHSKDALHKLEAEDGDHIYYLEATNEIVFLSQDGYIRTYFRPGNGIEYFNKQ